MNSRLAAILVLLVCWAFASALSQDVSDSPSVAASIAASPSVAASTSAPSCDEILHCVSKGDSCTNSWSTDPTSCGLTNGTDCCAYGLVCTASKECATNNFGDKCAVNSDCVSAAGESLVCNTTSSTPTCVYLSYAGDSCDSDNICAPGFTCDSDVCTGQAYGQGCNATSPCSNGLYCPYLQEKPTCQYLLGAGQSCTDYAHACVVDTYCNASNVCAKMFTVEEGDACQNVYDCEDGNICSTDGKCIEPTKDVTSCDSDSDCSGGICQCSQFAGEKFCVSPNVDACVEDRSDALSCAAKYNCTSHYTNENSCFYQNCYSDLEDLQSCGCGNSDSIFDSCFYNDYCGGFPGWAIALIVVGAIAIVLAIVAVIFVVMKRNSNTYDSI